MSLLKTLSDPNVHKFITPLIGGLLGVLLSWVGNQLPPLKHANQPWRVIRLAIEIAILIVVINSWEDAVGVVSGSDTDAQVAGIAYFTVVFLLFCAIANDFWRLVRKPSPTLEADREAAKKRNLRQALMDNVRYKWIASVLENPNSLYHRSRIELGLQKNPDLVRQLQSRRREESWRSLPPNTPIFDEFVNLGKGGTLLIVGEPGGGKTTLLLELARDLLKVTDAEKPEQPVPVVLNLSSWGTLKRDRQPITTLKDWLVEELYTQYRVRREVGEALLQEESLTLLLDGLGEVRHEWRDACTAAIDQFQQDHGVTEMVVCSRIADYENLSQGLTRFREAVCVLPLDLPQVDAFLQQAGAALNEFRAAVRQDADLQRLVSKPLFLAVASLAYKDRSADELLGLSEQERSGILFDRYIEQMFEQRPMSKQQRDQMVAWLNLIAQKMGSEKEFLIERMQPTEWFDQPFLNLQYRLIFGLIFGLILGLILGLIFGPIRGSILGLLSGLILGVFAGSALDYISLVEAFQIPTSDKAKQEIFQQLKRRMGIGLSIGLIVGLLIGLIAELLSKFIEGATFNLTVGLILGLMIGLILGPVNGLIFGLKADVKKRIYPNEGIWRSFNNTILICVALIIFTLALYFLLSYALPLFVTKGIKNLIIAGVAPFPLLFGFLYGGGLACIQHFAMRVVLHRVKLIPWNFVTFFQQAEDRLFVQRTGGSYIFIHRYLQEHFASLISEAE